MSHPVTVPETFKPGTQFPIVRRYGGVRNIKYNPGIGTMLTGKDCRGGAVVAFG